MRHPETRGLTPDEQAVYYEWLWLLTRWGAHDVDEAHELALQRAAGDRDADADSPPIDLEPYRNPSAYPPLDRPMADRTAIRRLGL